MPNNISINVSGTWKLPASIDINLSGTYRQVIETYVNNSGTWKIVTPFYSRITVEALSATAAGFNAFSPSGGSANNYNLFAPLGLGTMNGSYTDTANNFDYRLSFGQGGSNSAAFTGLIVADGSGSLRTYLSAAASYVYVSGFGTGFWSWGTGSNQVYTPAQAGVVRSLMVYI